MPPTTAGYLAAVAKHSAGFAEEAARGTLEAPVEHCPGWLMSDLVWHLTEVHWFWSTIADELLPEPPAQSRRPSRPDATDLITAFEAGAAHLVDVLSAADQGATCWTWAPHQRDVAFITRHQVQEAAVHHWDAAHTSGDGTIHIAAEIAEDAIDEFFAFSTASSGDLAVPPPPPLAGPLVLRASDVGRAWTIGESEIDGALRIEPTDSDAPAMSGTAEELLLWLYDRIALPKDDVENELIERFRAHCFTT